MEGSKLPARALVFVAHILPQHSQPAGSHSWENLVGGCAPGQNEASSPRLTQHLPLYANMPDTHVPSHREAPVSRGE